MALNHQTTRLVFLDSGDLIAGNRVAVNPRDAGPLPIAILSAFPGDFRARQEAVHLLPRTEVPAGYLALGRDLAQAMQLDVAGALWELHTQGIAHVAAHELCLQITSDRRLDEVVDELERSAGLVGGLLWFPSPEASATALRMSGEPYQVREVEPAGYDRPTVVEITAQTRVQLIAPGATSGVDVVILADCSGSMAAGDLKPLPESESIHAPTPSPAIGLRRDEALRNELHRLLHMRLETSGRVSRLAVIGFTTECTHLFPKDGGMKEIDETSPPEVVAEFQRAIARVEAADGQGTSIPKALTEASKLLNEHACGNEKLIVLISDGAHYVQKGKDAQGELILGDEDPVDLMSRRHREWKIALHAIGISNEYLFDEWCRAKKERQKYLDDQSKRQTVCPNHALLQRLVDVTGGDPATVGDTDALQRYFSGLGTGVRRRLRRLRVEPLPQLTDNDRAVLAKVTTESGKGEVDAQVRADRLRLAQKLEGLFHTCATKSMLEGVKATSLFDTDVGWSTFKDAISHDVRSEGEFKVPFCEGLQATLDGARETTRLVGEQNRNKAGNYVDRPEDYEYPDLVRLFRSDQRIREIDSLHSDADNPKDSAKEMESQATYMKLVGVPRPRSDDAPTWARLQVIVMETMKAVFDDIIRILSAPTASQAAPQQPEPLSLDLMA